MIRECKHCGEEFNQNEKIRLRGGYANVCIDCHDERPDPDANTPVLRGVVAGSGKMQAISIVRFQNEHDADDYVRSFNSSIAAGFERTSSSSNFRPFPRSQSMAS